MKREVQYQIADQITPVELEQTGDHFRVRVGNHEYAVKAKPMGDQRLLLEVDGRQLELYIAFNGDKCYVWLDGYTWTVERAAQPKNRSLAKRPAQPDATGRLTATMPGLVRDVLVKEGDTVARGVPLVLLEAMKMELRIAAPHAGQVSKVHCTPGQVVERGQLLVEIIETGGQEDRRTGRQ